jgi:hypothetical protein
MVNNMSHEFNKQVPERDVRILGSKLEPLHNELLTKKLDGVVVSYETDDLFRTTNAPLEVMTEKDMVVDYYDFLSQVKTAAENDKDNGALNMLATAESFAENTIFLTHEDFQEATHGLAQYHEEFLRGNEAPRIIFFHRKQRDENSQSYVTRSIVEQIDPSVASRAQIATEDNLRDLIAECGNSTDLRIAVADDWMVTGNNVANDLGNLLRQLDDHRDKVQINLINVRGDQRTESINALDRVEETYGVGNKIPIIGYFESPVLARLHEDPTPTGSWSSVDYGFTSRLQEMRDYLHRKGIDRTMPYISTIKGSYK